MGPALATRRAAVAANTRQQWKTCGSHKRPSSISAKREMRCVAAGLLCRLPMPFCTLTLQYYSFYSLSMYIKSYICSDSPWFSGPFVSCPFCRTRAHPPTPSHATIALVLSNCILQSHDDAHAAAEGPVAEKRVHSPQRSVSVCGSTSIDGGDVVVSDGDTAVEPLAHQSSESSLSSRFVQPIIDLPPCDRDEYISNR